MRRKLGWERLLTAAIKRMRDEPFEYGKHDCALMAASIVAEITGSDPAADLRGQYDETSLPETPEATEALYEEVAQRAGLEELKHVDYAQRGDVVVYQLKPEDTPALGIVDMTGMFAVFPRTGGGIARLPVRKAKRGWRV